MKFFKKFAAVLIAMAVFTVGNIGILPRDAVEDWNCQEMCSQKIPKI